jgi:hypothetical protein
MSILWRRRQAYLAATIGVLTVLMACGLSTLAIRQRVVPPPQLHINIGGLHLVALTSRVIGQPPPVQCRFYPSSCAPPRSYDLYAIWLIDARQVPINPSAALQQILAMPLK